MKNLLLVDLSNVMHKSIAVNGELTFAGKFTGGVYGVLRQVPAQINKLNITDLIVCKDTKPYFRKLDFPNYKSDRKAVTDDPVFFKKFSDSKKFNNELMEILGVPVLAKKGFESDDFFAMAVRKYKSKFDHIYLMSSDSDLYQLLDENVSMIKGKGLYTLKDFQSEFGIPTDHWPWVVAMTGSHNGVPGIHKVGNVTAIKHLKSVEKPEDVVNFKNGEYRELIENNHKLALLPYRPWRLGTVEGKPFNERALMKFCAQLGITLPGSSLEGFRKVCKRRKNQL